ncbi:MAG TPA: glycosyltransferase family 4 protein [Anaerolineales bacterium]|jgi:glycosyltransferase involved in cell wall biosynthesis|nr:glycosyltransferase family 4 protein [Anaerolineales bacterium]
MHVGLIIYGSLDTLSGGYLYDRKLVEYLRSQGDMVEIISLPWRNYATHLTDNLRFKLPSNLDILIQDELNHPSLVFANRGRHPYPVISLVHHLRGSERRPEWQNMFYRWVEKKYLQSVDGFIFNSTTTKTVVDRFMKTEKPNIVAYPPTDRFGGPISEGEIIERARHKELRILFIGNLIYRKGLHTLLEAVRDQPSAFRVDVVGSLASDSQYTQRIKEYISRNQLSSFTPALPGTTRQGRYASGASVFLHGSLDREPLIEKLKNAHILVVPSSYEGFGIVYLEGMCFGLPAIGTTAGAASEIITDGQDGFLIEPENPKELVDKLKLLQTHRDVLLQMSLAARARYLRQPKWDETAGRVREFLLKQIEKFPPPPCKISL